MAYRSNPHQSGSVADRRVYEAGDVIFQEGEEGNIFFLIEKGSVEIYKTASDGTRLSLGFNPAGSLFGEMAMIDNQPRMASAKAVEQTIVRAIPRDALERKMTDSDPLIQAIVRGFIENIRTNAARQTAMAAMIANSVPPRRA